MNFGQHCVKNLFHYQKMSKIQKKNISGISIKFCIKKSNKIFHEFWSTMLEKFISLSLSFQNTRKIIFLKSALNSASNNRIKFLVNFGQQCLKNLFHYQEVSEIQKK